MLENIRECSLLSTLQVNSNPIWFDRNDCAGCKLISVKLDHSQAGFCLLPRRKINKPNNPGMRFAVDDCQFAEVLIQCYQNPAFPMSSFQYFIVTGILGPIAGPNGVMALRL